MSDTKVVSSNPVNDDVFPIQQYVIKFVNELRQVSDFLWVLRFPPPIKTDRHDITEILLKVALDIIKPNLYYVRHPIFMTMFTSVT